MKEVVSSEADVHFFLGFAFSLEKEFNGLVSVQRVSVRQNENSGIHTADKKNRLTLPVITSAERGSLISLAPPEESPSECDIARGGRKRISSTLPI
jgi:hypothetical protein